MREERRNEGEGDQRTSCGITRSGARSAESRRAAGSLVIEHGPPSRRCTGRSGRPAPRSHLVGWHGAALRPSLAASQTDFTLPGQPWASSYQVEFDTSVLEVGGEREVVKADEVLTLAPRSFVLLRVTR